MWWTSYKADCRFAMSKNLVTDQSRNLMLSRVVRFNGDIIFEKGNVLPNGIYGQIDNIPVRIWTVRDFLFFGIWNSGIMECCLYFSFLKEVYLLSVILFYLLTFCLQPLRLQILFLKLSFPTILNFVTKVVVSNYLYFIFSKDSAKDMNFRF